MSWRLHSAASVAALLAALVLAALAGARPGPSGDSALRRVLARELPAAARAGAEAMAGRGSPEAIQAQYDAARDLQQALEEAKPVSRGCEPLLAAAERFARGEIRQAEGVDRPSAALLAAGVREVAAAQADLKRLPRNCTAGAVGSPPPPGRELDEPRSNEAFPGRVRARVPAGTTAVDVAVNGQVVGRATLRGREASIALGQRYGRWNLEFRFLEGKTTLGVARSNETWLLPQTAERHIAPGRKDRQLAAKLALIASGFNGHVGIWTQNLSTDKTAGWNEDARFPAASTVKLAVLVATLAKFGPRPERSPVAYDLRTLAAWSSNLAANRLLRKLGGSEDAGSEIAQATLTRLGATSSTYTGNYRIGTGVTVGGATRGAPDPPPLVSQRVTTARDLGRIFYLLHSAAMRDPTSRKVTGLTLHEARVGLALLLASQPTGDNLGLFRPSVGTTPMAQKNGWLNDARHTAAILYPEAGPTLVVLLTYRPRITRSEAATLAAKVLRLVVPAALDG